MRRLWLQLARRFGKTAAQNGQRRFPDRNVEIAARYLVQKIARENAALHAIHVLEARQRNWRADKGPQHGIAGLLGLGSVTQAHAKHRQAMNIRHAAVVEMRLALGLAEHPSAIEVNGWGEAP